MPSVFISYRQVDGGQRMRVRSFAEKLLVCGIDVILDQFYLDAHPGGPPEKWPKWSSDQATNAEHVIIVGSEPWFLCFDGKQAPGVGLGAACEADDLRTRIYKAANINEDIRVVLFDDSDAAYISSKLEGYHRFHAEHDFANIVRWLDGTVPTNLNSSSQDRNTSTPNNLPRLQPFFGREKELASLREALRADNRSWGALIDGPGGMGKTSLAVRAAYDCPPGQFQRIIFVSAKDREMEDDGVHPLAGFILPGFLEMLNELARELGQPDIPKAPEDERIRLLLDALRAARVLIILDNLESLAKSDRDQIFTFVKRLPQGCKAILTSRRRIGSGSEELILEQLDEIAALATLADLARHQKLLAKSSKAELIALYKQTGGTPLLLRWVAGQLGRGSCRTLSDALNFLRSCPPDNDPLEFIFGDLVKEFDPQETRLLCALTYFVLPAKVEHIAAVAGFEDAQHSSVVSVLDEGHPAEKEPYRSTPPFLHRRPPRSSRRGERKARGESIALVETALRSLANRSLVVPDQEEEAFALALSKIDPPLLRETDPLGNNG